MKHIVRLLGFCFMWFHAAASMAQDANYTQYFGVNLYNNPAFAGTIPVFRVSTAYRKHQVKMQDVFESNNISFDYNFKNINSGVGLVVNDTRVSTYGLHDASASLVYAYRINIKESFVLSMGLQGTMGMRSMGYSALVFEDQIKNNGSTFESMPAESIMYPDVAFGMVGFSEKFWIGASAFHLLKPDISLYRSSSKLPMRYVVQGGAKFALNEYFNLMPALMLQMQNPFTQFDISAIGELSEVFFFGGGYRGLPFQKVGGRINQEGIFILSGVKHKGFTVGVSYDFNFSGLNGTGGNAEFTLSYALPYDFRPNPKWKHVKCPLQ